MTKPEAKPNPEKTNVCDIVFYCKDCSELVDTERCGRKYVYKCKKCGTKNVAFGTSKSIHGFFRVGEGDGVRKKKVPQEEPVVEEKKSE